MTDLTPRSRSPRWFGWTALAALLLSWPQPAAAHPLDLAQPTDSLQALRKILCAVTDGEPVYYSWQGEVYSQIPGERDRHLFNVQGLSTRACISLVDGAGEPGFRMVSREVMLYLDPATDTVLQTWDNPWTNETVTVLPVANDPVNSRPFWAQGDRGAFAFPGQIQGDHAVISFVIPLFYPNPLAGDYPSYVGGYYQATEMFNFFVPLTELVADAQTDVESVVFAWTRVAPWLPWQAMGDRPGGLLIQATGLRRDRWEAVPEPLRQAVATEFALYQTPPPLDDNRPNETSLTNFRDYLESLPATESGD